MFEPLCCHFCSTFFSISRFKSQEDFEMLLIYPSVIYKVILACLCFGTFWHTFTVQLQTTLSLFSLVIKTFAITPRVQQLLNVANICYPSFSLPFILSTQLLIILFLIKAFYFTSPGRSHKHTLSCLYGDVAHALPNHLLV